jgi:uncharacterized membrane protein
MRTGMVAAGVVPARRYAAVSVLVAAFFLIYALIGLTRHWQFRSSAYDLGIYDQFLWHLSRFETPASSVRGMPNLFADHFHPILLLLVPAFWAAPAAETLITAQAFLFAISIVPVYLFANRMHGSAVALALSAAYGLFWGLQRAAEFDFHEYAFAPVLIGLSILALARKSWRLLWACAIAIILVKEDLIPLVVFEGIYLTIAGERKQGPAMAAAGLGAFAVIVGWLMPWLGGGDSFEYTHLYNGVLTNPWMIPAALVTPFMKLRTAFLWVAPFALLPLLSPFAMLLVPFALSRFLSDSPTHWGTIFHYGAPVAPIAAMSAVDGLARVRRKLADPWRRRRVITGFAAACLVLSAILPGQQPLWDLLRAKAYVRSAAMRTGHEIVRRFPPGGSVVAQGPIVPHLTHRDAIYVLDTDAPDADFVVAATGLHPWPLATIGEVEALLEARKRRGYVVMLEQDGWVVLRRVGR